MPDPMMGLIVNADDFGQSRGVTDGIVECHADGIVTSTTIMANGVAMEYAARASRDYPALGVGVHLNYCEGRPVAPVSEVPSLVDSRGRFWTKFALVRRHLTGRIELDHLRRETEAQIDVILAAGITPTHVDSHKNIHAYPPFFRCVAETAASRNIPAIRMPLESIRISHYLLRPRDAWRTSLLGFAAARSRGILKQSGLVATDHFSGAMATGRLDEAWLVAWIGGLLPGTTELMVHPGHCDAELIACGTRLTTSREIERRALTSPRIRRSVEESHVELMNYRTLNAHIPRLDTASQTTTP